MEGGRGMGQREGMRQIGGEERQRQEIWREGERDGWDRGRG